MAVKYDNRGWTLIELLIVLTLFAIMLCASYPSYIQHLRETRRTEAHRLLLSTSTKQEQWFSRHFSYATQLNSLQAQDLSNKHYQLELSFSGCNETLPPDCFELTARPLQKSDQNKDTDCLSILLDHTGRRMPLKCWE